MDYDIKKIEKCLDLLLLNRAIRVDRFDANYLDDFHKIMKENYGIRTCSDGHNQTFNNLKILLGNSQESLLEMTETLKTLEGLDSSKYSPKESDRNTKAEHKYDRVENWSSTENLKLDADVQNSEKINELQKQYSIASGGSDTNQSPSTFWDRPGLTEDKNQLFHSLCAISSETSLPKKVLCLGPRWASEISYISNTFKCDALGLDLFTTDPSLVKVGDMHEMPFEDSTFDIVYQKNTFNKSYDIRKCLDECVRFLKNGGVIISDEIIDYTIGVNEIARTNISDNSWYGLYLQDNLEEILVNKHIKLGYDWASRAGLYAIRINKP